MAQDEDAATIKACAPGGVGLLIIDMINDMAFPEAEALRPKAERIADVILALRDEADRLKVPVVYVNDNLRPVAFGEIQDRRGLQPPRRPRPRHGP